jgi:hypothetical protein
MMANSAKQDSRQRDRQPGSGSGGQPGSEQRSEGLLPAGQDDDGRYDVAEEVNLDQQSDALRRVGKPPKGITAKEWSEAMQGDDRDVGTT